MLGKRKPGDAPGVRLPAEGMAPAPLPGADVLVELEEVLADGPRLRGVVFSG